MIQFTARRPLGALPQATAMSHLEPEPPLAVRAARHGIKLFFLLMSGVLGTACFPASRGVQQQAFDHNVASMQSVLVRYEVALGSRNDSVLAYETRDLQKQYDSANRMVDRLVAAGAPIEQIRANTVANVNAYHRGLGEVMNNNAAWEGLNAGLFDEGQAILANLTEIHGPWSSEILQAQMQLGATTLRTALTAGTAIHAHRQAAKAEAKKDPPEEGGFHEEPGPAPEPDNVIERRR